MKKYIYIITWLIIKAIAVPCESVDIGDPEEICWEYNDVEGSSGWMGEDEKDQYMEIVKPLFDDNYEDIFPYNLIYIRLDSVEVDL